MPSSYHLTEPFPAPVKPNVYIGRGGAGNITRARPSTKIVPTQAKTNSSNPNLYLVESSTPYPPPRSLSTASNNNKPSARKHYTAGRGGIGNLHPAAERAMFSFDEELERASKAEQARAPIYHIGIGGCGNVVGANSARQMSDASSSRSSSGSISSADSERRFRSGLEKVKMRFSRT